MTTLSETPRFPIGTKFVSGGKHKRQCTVVDYWRTYNSAGTLVRARYVATHEFMGQTLTDCDVVEYSVAKGLVS